MIDTVIDKNEIKLKEDENDRFIPPKLFDNTLDEQETLQWLASRFRQLDDARPDDGFDLRYKQFMSFLAWREDGRANVNLPIEYATIENKMADILSLKPIVTFTPTEKDDMYKTELYKHLWDYVWNEADTDEELYEHVLTALIFGTSIWFEGVHKETYRRFVPKMNKDGSVTQEARMQTKSWLKGFAWDLRFCWIDSVNNINLASDCFLQEVDLSKDQIEALKYDPNYNSDAVEAYIKQYGGLEGDQDSIRYNDFVTKEEEHDVMNTKYSLMHYYNKDKGIYIVTDHQFQYILREGVNPYPHGELPISVLVDHKNYKSLYGRGECELLENTKYERNTIRNQLIDYVRESNTINFAVGENVQLEDMELINGVVRQINFTGNIGDAQYIKPPTMDSGLWNMDNMLAQDATWITGIDNNALVGSPQKTAFEAKLQEQTKLKRIYLFLRQMDFFYTRMGQQRLANMQFYLPLTTGKKILGDKFDMKRLMVFKDKQIKEIMDIPEDSETFEVEQMGVRLEEAKGETAFLELTPDMIQSNLDITVTTPTTTPILKELNKQDLQEAMNQVMSIMQMQTPQAQELAQKFKIDKVVKQQFKNIGLDPDEFIGDDDTPSDQADLRQELVGDVPAPGKPTTPGQRQQAPTPSTPQQMAGLPPMPERGGNMNV